MARKAADVVNITLRLRETLRKRLERASERSERPLNGEIVARLEQSFETEDKIALVTEEQQKNLRLILASLANGRYASRPNGRYVVKRDTEMLGVKSAESIRQIDEESKRAEEEVKREAAIVDALLGDDVAAREAIRAIALLLAGNPGWANTADGIHRITQNIVAAIKAAAESGVKQ
jgi:hypothetical protein